MYAGVHEWWQQSNSRNAVMRIKLLWVPQKYNIYYNTGFGIVSHHLVSKWEVHQFSCQIKNWFVLILMHSHTYLADNGIMYWNLGYNRFNKSVEFSNLKKLHHFLNWKIQRNEPEAILFMTAVLVLGTGSSVPWQPMFNITAIVH
jgi:hypothetical protein